MSSPDSTIVVQTRTSKSFSQKPTMTRSRVSSVICPWPIATRASGTSSRSRLAARSMESTRLWMKKTWPSRSSSRRMAAATCFSSYAPTKVSTGCRSSGGVRIVDISRMPVSDISSVRGIGVADIDSTSTEARSVLRYSLCSTPKRCSSSTMTRPRSLNRVLCCSSRWVPMTMSTVPSTSPANVACDSLALSNRDSDRTVTGNCAIRSENVEKCCCCASSVVGTSTATCLPSCAALNAARTAISVLP